MGQIFTLKTIVKKYLEKGETLQVTFIDLKEVYHRVGRNVLWRVLRICEVGVCCYKLWRGIKKNNIVSRKRIVNSNITGRIGRLNFDLYYESFDSLLLEPDQSRSPCLKRSKVSRTDEQTLARGTTTLRELLVYQDHTQ